jgi:hypothetical protein
MKATANAHFAITSWDEKPYSEGDGLPKMTRASVRKTFTGDIEGEGQVEYLMMYRADGSATFVGLERINARIAGKNGSFVLRCERQFSSPRAVRCSYRSRPAYTLRRRRRGRTGSPPTPANIRRRSPSASGRRPTAIAFASPSIQRS